jgi:hypothetical protein
MNIYSILTMSAEKQYAWEMQMQEMGHKTISTFYGDLTIAEMSGGEKALNDTYNKIVKDWGGNVQYFTEFVIALNHKIWEWYGHNDTLAKVYDGLWRKASEYAETHFEGDDLSYYYREID